MSQTVFDLVVIGAGPGGYVAAIRGAQEGLKTAIIEGHKMGGECLNYGCIPSKALITAAHTFESIKHAQKMGIEVDRARLNMSHLVDWKDKIVKQLTGGIAQLMRANKVTSISAFAAFSSYDPQSGIKTLSLSNGESVQAKNVIVATGSESVNLPFLPVDGKYVCSSKEALDLREIPERIIVVGGGFIGLELGTFFMKVGAELSVVEASPLLLPGTDRECVSVVEKKLKKQGAQIFTNTKALGYKKKDSMVFLDVERENGEKETLSGDLILVTVGRKARTQGLDLEKIGLNTTDRGFISVNARLETSCPGVYAIGDVIGGAMLAHKASKEALVAVDCILNPSSRMDMRALPWAIFVDPEIAVVGHSAESAKDAGWDPVESRCPFAANGRALTTGESDGFVKLISDRKTNRLLGAHMVGPDVSNLIAEVALGIELGASAEDIALTVHAHPTLPETIMEAAEAVHGKAIHFFDREAQQRRKEHQSHSLST